MKVACKKPVLMVTDDLPVFDAVNYERFNCIYGSPCIDVKINQKHYYWNWQYPTNKPNRIDVILKGDDSSYKVQLDKFDCISDDNHLLDWSAYNNEVACILFSAVHDELISIIEQILEDQLVVISVQTSKSNDDFMTDPCSQSDCVRLGFSLCNAGNRGLVDGVLILDESHLRNLADYRHSIRQHNNQAAENIVTNVPLMIDSFSLSHEEFGSLSVSSVIRLQNSSLLTDKSHIFLEVGASRIAADVKATRGNITNSTNHIAQAKNI